MRRMRQGLAGLALAAVLPFWQPVAVAQEDVRGMQDEALYTSRPRGKGRRGAPIRFRRTGPSIATPDRTAAVGVTIWRLRPARSEDPAAVRDILYGEASSGGEWTPERVTGEPELEVGQRFRLSVETPRRGHLYVVNRPMYADGAARPPVLIFPLTRIRGGDNRVFPGRVFEIPSRADRPSYFHIGGGAGLVGEEVLILVTPSPLEVPESSTPVALPSEQVAEWERRWGAPSGAVEVGGQGLVYTTAEKAAASDAGRVLTQGDPLPQRIYHVASPRGAPLLLRLVIRVRASPGV